MEGHCMKCKTKRKMKDVKITQTSRGGFMGKGSCTECGCKMCSIKSKKDAEAAIASGEAKKAY